MLAIFSFVPVLARAPSLRILDATISIEAAIVFTIENTAVFADVWRSALTRTKPIANTFTRTREDVVFIIKSTWNFDTFYTIVATVFAVLCIFFVVATNRSRTRHVGAVNAVIPIVAQTKSIGANSIIRAVA
jgi:hypothetical protein